MIKENPLLGKGIGTFMSHFRSYSDLEIISYAHNCFLQIWAETGIFSVLSFLGFLITLIYKGIDVFKKYNDFIILGLTCAIFGFVIHSLFDPHFYSLQLAVLFWSLSGLLAAAINQSHLC
jgi:O-antigen ligase